MCQEEVSILAINYMDRVLNKLPISKNNLQLLAATCTFLASKLREPSTHALQPEVLIYYTDNSITKRDLMVSGFEIIGLFDETRETVDIPSTANYPLNKPEAKQFQGIVE